MKKQRIYYTTECPGFDAYVVEERWEVGNKWYIKETVLYIHRGTLGYNYCENHIETEWKVATFNENDGNCSLVVLREESQYIE